MKQRHGLTWAILMVSCGALAGVGGAASLASAQGKKGWEILVAYNKSDLPKGSTQIALRPNVAQPVFLYLSNANLGQATDVEVRLVRGFSKGNVQHWRELAKAKMKKNFRQPQLLAFEAAAEPGKKEDAAKGPPTTPNDDGAPFLFQLLVTEMGKQPSPPIPLEVEIEQPQEYMETATVQFDKKTSRLSAQLKIKADSAEPPCPVELILDPRVVPVRKLLTGKLDAMKPEVELRAEGIKFKAEGSKVKDGSRPQNGRIYLTVDGYQRAFMFKTSFDQGVLDRLGQTRVRLIAPRYFSPKTEDKSGPKGELKARTKIPVDIEADGTDTAKWIEVALDLGEGRYAQKQLLQGLRKQGISFAVGPEGNPEFKTFVSDWKVEFDPEGVSGRQLIRVQVLDRDKVPLDLADEQDAKDEEVLLFSRDPLRNPHAPLRYDRPDKVVYAEIVVDETGPEGVQFVDLPMQAAPGDKLTLKAKANERDKVEQAPISSVQFLVGDPPKEPGTSGIFDPTSRLWQADIPVPADAKEKLAVAVRATVATGLSASDTGTIAVQAGPPGGVEKSKITGQVKWDNRIQREKTVTLSPLGKAKVIIMTATTNDEGVYLFLKVPPGKYQVLASVPGYSKGTATAIVTKDTGETIKADINLK